MERTSAGPPSAARFVDWLLLIWLLAWRWRVFTPPEPRLSASSSAAALAETASAPAWPPISASRKPGTSGNKMMRTVSLCTQASGSNSTGWAGLQVWQMPRGRLTKFASRSAATTRIASRLVESSASPGADVDHQPNLVWRHEVRLVVQHRASSNVRQSDPLRV